jgi:ATP adenylyltransferase/5',5'''-P-1,P-4-tetraphosphate phosphorylase II
MNFSEKVRSLIKEQIVDWDLAGKNYRGLNEIRVKTMNFNGYVILVQWNPQRIISSSAKVDSTSIKARPCFLCRQNLPAEQKGLLYKDDYIVLVNPFPIFMEHLTIPFLSHIDQQISGRMGEMLDLAMVLTDFVVFYNGPKCGASAPDHLHFQAVIKGSMPIENDFLNDRLCQLMGKYHETSVYCWRNYGRSVLTFEGSNRDEIVSLFSRLYHRLELIQSAGEEPMMNVIVLTENQKWLVHIFPRKQHRPNQYFERGVKQILLSPASVDLGGVFITPREEDFWKIDASDIVDICKQVCIDDDVIHEIAKSLVD